MPRPMVFRTMTIACVILVVTLGVKVARHHWLSVDWKAVAAAKYTQRQQSLADSLTSLPRGGDRMIVDPRYGLYYTDGIGATIGLEGLQTGRIPTLHSLPLSSATAYPPSHYYDFDYQITKTANWTRSAPRRAAYRVLRALSAGRIDRCRLPAILEWPQILLSSALTGILGLTDLLFLLT